MKKLNIVAQKFSEPKSIELTITDCLLSGSVIAVRMYYSVQVTEQDLIHGLQKALNDYPLVAGRLQKQTSGLVIFCNNQGVSLSVQHHQFPISDVMLKRDSSETHDYLCDVEDMGNVIETQSPLMTLKINYFSDNGMCLGIGWHHSIGDLVTWVHFMKAFSRAVAHQPYEKPLIVSNRITYLNNTIKDPECTDVSIQYFTDDEKNALIHKLLADASEKRRLQFYFSSEELIAMQRDFNKYDSLLSLNDALCAHLYHHIARCSDKFSRSLSIAVNQRSRVRLPANLMGNLINSITLYPETNNNIYVTAKAISGRLKRYQYLKTSMDHFTRQKYVNSNGGMSKIANFLPKSLDVNNGIFLLSNLSGAGMYEGDFGLRAPFYVSVSTVMPFAWIVYIIEGFNNQGLICECTLPGDIADKVTQKDILQEIHKYRPKDELLPELAKNSY